MTKSIYNLKTLPSGEVYTINKFDHDLEVESSYTVSLGHCDCPQGERDKLCRHQKMLPMFLALARQDTEYFLDFDTKTWHRPLALEYEVEYHDLLVKRREAAAKQPAPTGIKVVDSITSMGLAAQAIVKADTATLPLSVSPAASVATEVPCVATEAAPIKRRRI